MHDAPVSTVKVNTTKQPGSIGTLLTAPKIRVPTKLHAPIKKMSVHAQNGMGKVGSASTTSSCKANTLVYPSRNGPKALLGQTPAMLCVHRVSLLGLCFEFSGQSSGQSYMYDRNKTVASTYSTGVIITKTPTPVHLQLLAKLIVKHIRPLCVQRSP